MSEEPRPLLAGSAEALKPLPLARTAPGTKVADVLVMRELTMRDEALVFTALDDLEGPRSCDPP